MLRILKQLVLRALKLTPYSLTKKRLPQPTFDVVQLALAHYCSNSPDGTIVQIGAFDGVSNDPLHPFIWGGHTRAVLVEPVEAHFRKLEAYYADCPHVSLVHAAIAHDDKMTTMYRAKKSGRWEANEWVGQITSFDTGHLLKHGVEEHEIEEMQVTGLKLSTLLSRLDVERIGFLQIDTEGFDAEVVKMALTLPMLPDFINFEHRHLAAESAVNLFGQLEKHGYKWVHSRYDTLALHERVIAALGSRSIGSETIAVPPSLDTTSG